MRSGERGWATYVSRRPGWCCLARRLVDHFDDSYYTHGWNTAYQGAYRQKVAGTLQRPQAKHVGPFQMSFWWRPYSSANWTAFDCGMERFMNRFALFVTDGEQGQELVFRCSASTLEQHAAEVYVPLDRLDYEPGNWYHIEVSCRGEDPSTMKLLVDGMDLGIRRGMTWLSADVNSSSEELIVEGTEQFPPRGAVRIGTEIIEYDEVGAGALRELVRGARGTNIGEYFSGTPVQLLGYAMPITVDIMKGRAEIASELRKFSAVRIVSHDDEQPFLVDGDPTPVIIGGYNPDNENPTITAVPLWGQTEEEALGAFQEEGLALWGSWIPANGDTGYDSGSGGPAADNHFEGPGGGLPPGGREPSDPPSPPPSTDGGGGGGGGGSNPGQPGGGSGSQDPEMKFGGWEVVHYTRQGNQFTVQRYLETAWQGAAEPYFQIVREVTTERDWGCFLVPISIHAEGAAEEDDYLNPELPDHRTILERYYPGEEHTAYALLGTDTPEDAFEVISYNSINKTLPSSGFYFVRDWNLGRLTNHFFLVSHSLAEGGGSADDSGEDDAGDDGEDAGDDGTDAGDDGTDAGDDGSGDDGGDDGGGDGGDDGNDDGTPAPGGGVPPGLRDPSDPVDPPAPGEDGGSDDGDDGGVPSPGTGTPEPGAGGGSGGNPVAPDPEFEEGVDNDEGDSGSQTEGPAEADTDSREEGGSRDSDSPPPPEEPTEDESGGGGEPETPELSGESDDKTPNQPAKFDEDLEPREDSDDTSGFRNPSACPRDRKRPASAATPAGYWARWTGTTAALPMNAPVDSCRVSACTKASRGSRLPAPVATTASPSRMRNPMRRSVSRPASVGGTKPPDGVPWRTSSKCASVRPRRAREHGEPTRGASPGS